MSLPSLSWNMDEQGVACISATDADGRMFPLCDVWRNPSITLGGMGKDAARDFQILAAERICAAWNADKHASKIASDHAIDPGLGLSEWGKGHNAACEQIAAEIIRRWKR